MASTKQLKTTSSSSSSSSSSAEKIAKNDDLSLLILENLPIKSLLKFKCVSKHWLSLITNPRFTRRGYLSRSPCICGLFLHTRSLLTYQFDFISLHCKHFGTLSSVHYPSHMKIIHSCNGLLLCSDIPLIEAGSIYYVCNPTTKQSTTLPPLSQIGEICSLYLAFDPLKSPYFKVICVRQYKIEKPNFHIEIYSSKSRKWRVSEANFILDLGIRMHGGVFWNGGIHWYTDSGPCFYLDVEEEQIKEMPMPNPIPDGWYRRRVLYFGESRGHLYLIEIYGPRSTQFDVWELQRDYSGWSLKYRVNLDGLAREYPGMAEEYLHPSALKYCNYEIYCIVEGETEEESYMVLRVPATIIRYDFSTQFVTKLCDFPPPPTAAGSSSVSDHRQDEGNFYYSGAFQYIETLVRVRLKPHLPMSYNAGVNGRLSL